MADSAGGGLVCHQVSVSDLHDQHVAMDSGEKVAEPDTAGESVRVAEWQEKQRAAQAAAAEPSGWDDDDDHGQCISTALVTHKVDEHEVNVAMAPTHEQEAETDHGTGGGSCAVSEWQKQQQEERAKAEEAAKTAAGQWDDDDDAPKCISEALVSAQVNSHEDVQMAMCGTERRGGEEQHAAVGTESAAVSAWQQRQAESLRRQQEAAAKNSGWDDDDDHHHSPAPAAPHVASTSPQALSGGSQSPCRQRGYPYPHRSPGRQGVSLLAEAREHMDWQLSLDPDRHRQEIRQETDDFREFIKSASPSPSPARDGR